MEEKNNKAVNQIEKEVVVSNEDTNNSLVDLSFDEKTKSSEKDWVKFIEVFGDIEDPITLLNADGIGYIAKGATPIEAFLLQAFHSLSRKYYLLNAKLDSLTRQNKQNSLYPGSLQSKHPSSETDPFIQGILY